MFAATAAAAPPPPDAPKIVPAPVGAVAPIDRVIAFVDGTPIWWSTWSERMVSSGVPADPAARKQYETAMVESLIDEVLVMRRAEAMHIEVGETEIDAALKEIEEQNHLDEAGLVAVLTPMGYTLAHYREELRHQVMQLRAVNQAANMKPGATPEERERLRTEWVASLRKTARIERR
jgi:peptidyl-prolyl cis-trans isomerase SurA